jgi:hypothetical protein
MNKGDLVNVYVYSPHDSDLANEIKHTGIFLHRDRGAQHHGGAWVVLVDGSINAFLEQWWNCKLVNEEIENV